MAPNPRSRRRWLQFSLRSFLILVAVIAACLAAKFNHPRFTHANINQMRVINTIAGDIHEIDWSPILGTGGGGTQAHLWDAASGKLLRSLDMGPVVGGLGVVFSPDGTLAAVSHRNSDARLFDVATGNILHTFAKSMTHHVCFDPHGKRLAIAYVDGTLALWDVATGKQLAIRETGGEEAYGVEWSPDGRLLLSSGRKSDIVVWDPRDMTILRRVPAPEWVIGARFTPDGTRLITAGGAFEPRGERKVQIWAVPNWWDRWFGGP